MCQAQLAGPLEDQGGQAQGGNGNEVAGLGAHVPQKLAQWLRVSDGGVVAAARCWQAACAVVDEILDRFQYAGIHSVLALPRSSGQFR